MRGQGAELKRGKAMLTARKLNEETRLGVVQTLFPHLRYRAKTE